jgi:hypothetical protein
MQMGQRAIIIGFAVVLCSAVAFAGARQHYQAGADYYAQGRYEKAIEEFEEAYRLDPTKHLILYNVAQAYEKAGELKTAVERFERLLERDPETNKREASLEKIAKLKAQIAATGINVKTNEAGAVIYVDDKEVGTTPTKGLIPLEPGAHEVRISKDGFKTFKQEVAVSYGHGVPLEATLEPGADEPAPEPVTAPAEAAEPVAAVGQKADKKIGAQDVVPWVLTGVGGAAAIVGLGVLGGMALSDDNHDQAVIADIVGWSGVGLFVAGAVWGIVHVTKKKKAGEKQVSLADGVVVVPLVDRRGAGVAASFTF